MQTCAISNQINGFRERAIHSPGRRGMQRHEYAPRVLKTDPTRSPRRSQTESWDRTPRSTRPARKLASRSADAKTSDHGLELGFLKNGHGHDTPMEDIVSQPSAADDIIALDPFSPVPAGDRETALVETFSKQLRRLRAMTEEVLLKRTEVDHQQQLLISCEGYLHKSTVELMSALRIRLPEDLSRKKAKKKRKKKKPKKERSQQDFDRAPKAEEANLQGEAAASSTKVDSGFAAGSSIASFKLVPGAGTQQEKAPSVDIPSLYGQYLKDFESVQRQREMIKESRNQLSNLEYRLEKKEKAIVKKMRSSEFATNLRTEMLDSELNSSETNSQPATKSETPTLLAEYFSRQGDVGIFTERLQDLDYSHEEGRAAREFLADRGDPAETLEVSNDEFETKYQLRRLELQNELLVAREDASALAGRCAEAGLDIDAHRKVKRSVHTPSAIYSSGEQDDAELSSPALFSGIREVGLHTKLTQEAISSSSRRVDWWLRHSFGGFGELELAAPSAQGRTPISNGSVTSLQQIHRRWDESLASYEQRSFDPGIFDDPRTQGGT